MQVAILNLIIAVIWLFLSPDRRFGDLVLGYAVGYGLLFCFRPVLGRTGYFRRSMALFRFGFIFLGLFLESNYQIAKAILIRPRNKIDPNFITYDLTGLRKGEILILTHCITLTPGTTSVDISPDMTTLTIHAFDAIDPEGVREGINRNLKENILKFTR